MRLFGLALVATAVFATAAAQQAIDPAYLRQYYAQIAAQSGAAQRSADATPIHENQDQAPSAQFLPHAQQIKAGEQVAYVPQSQPAPPTYKAPKKVRPAHQYQSLQGGQGGRLKDEEEEEDYDPNPSYQFGFDVKDDEFTNYQNRKEVRDGGVIKGSYSVVDSDGFIRTVKYTADPKEGFRAEVIREPTDIVVKIPEPRPELQSHRQAPAQQQVQYSKQQYAPAQQPSQLQHQPAYRAPNLPKHVRPEYHYEQQQ